MSESRFQEPVTSLGKKVYAKNSEAINRSIEDEILEKLSKKNNLDKNILENFYGKEVKEKTSIVNFNLGSAFNKYNNFFNFKELTLQGFVDYGKDKNIQDVGTPDTEEIDYSIVKEAVSNKHRYGEILKPYKNGFLIVSDDVAKDNKYFDIFDPQEDNHVNILTPLFSCSEKTYYINYKIAKAVEKYIESGLSLYFVFPKAYKNKAFVINFPKNKNLITNLNICINQGEKEDNEKQLYIYNSLPKGFIDNIADMNGIFEVFNFFSEEQDGDHDKKFLEFVERKRNLVSKISLLKSGYTFSFIQKYIMFVQSIEAINKEDSSEKYKKNHQFVTHLLKDFEKCNSAKEISEVLMKNLNKDITKEHPYFLQDFKEIYYSKERINSNSENFQEGSFSFTLNNFLENFIDLYFMHQYTDGGTRLKQGPIDTQSASQIDCMYYWKHCDLFNKTLNNIGLSDFPLFLEKGEVFNNRPLAKHIDEFRRSPAQRFRCNETYGLKEDVKEKVSLILNEAMSQETGLLIPYNACVELEDPVFKYARFIESDKFIHIFLHDDNDRYLSELFCKGEDEFRYWLVNRRQIFDEDDNLTNTFNHLYVKLASCIRDWKVLIERDRTMNFRGRRVPTGVKTTQPRYIYLPRVRYKTNPNREQVKREKVFYSESRKFSGERRAHIRRLPQGMKPSKTQLVIAQHNNITIPDNHTYVKESIWGKSKMNQRQIKYRTKSLNGLLYITNDSIDHHKQIAEMSPAGFEEYCGEYIKKLGYEVYKRNNYDGGIDIRGIKKDGSRLFAQCKHPLESGNPVGPDVVRELKGSLDLERQDIEDCEVELMVITSTRYTHKACEAAQKLNIKLVRTDEME